MITLDSAQVIIILAAAGAALAAVCLCLLVMLLVRNKGNDSGGDLPGLMADEFERSRRELSASLADMNRRIDETNRRSHDVQSNLIKTVGDALDAIRVSDLEQNERLMRALMTSMDKMRESNEQKLEQMRLTVDEKLDSTLTQRLNTSFRAVSEGLESVNRSLGEMKELSAGVTDNVTALNRVLTNVKSRGTWAEIQLENILDETIPGMYVKNFSPDGSQSRVEFAVKLPRAETGEITYLPLDSKFPMEDYVRLCNAREQGDAQAAAAAAKQLLVAIVNEAKRIRKYISPPVTTPYAVMYLATEGLFAEVTSSSDAIAERIKTKLNVLIAGPTTVTALLSSLSMGYKAVAVNEKANEVRELLIRAREQYEKFGEVLERARRKLDDAGKALDEARDRNRIINDKFKRVEMLDRED